MPRPSSHTADISSDDGSPLDVSDLSDVVANRYPSPTADDSLDSASQLSPDIRPPSPASSSFNEGSVAEDDSEEAFFTRRLPDSDDDGQDDVEVQWSGAQVEQQSEGGESGEVGEGAGDDSKHCDGNAVEDLDLSVLPFLPFTFQCSTRRVWKKGEMTVARLQRDDPFWGAWSIKKVLRHGHSSVVYLGEHHLGAVRAIKVTKEPSSTAEHNLYQGFQCQSLIKGPGVASVDLFGYFELLSKRHGFIMMPQLRGTFGDAIKAIKQVEEQLGTSVTPSHRLNFRLSVIPLWWEGVQGLITSHAHGVGHCAITADKFGLSSTRPVICELFGFGSWGLEKNTPLAKYHSSSRKFGHSGSIPYNLNYTLDSLSTALLDLSVASEDEKTFQMLVIEITELIGKARLVDVGADLRAHDIWSAAISLLHLDLPDSHFEQLSQLMDELHKPAPPVLSLLWRLRALLDYHTKFFVPAIVEGCLPTLCPLRHEPLGSPSMKLPAWLGKIFEAAYADLTTRKSHDGSYDGAQRIADLIPEQLRTMGRCPTEFEDHPFLSKLFKH